MTWTCLDRPDAPCPVLSLLGSASGLWAGGPGGIARLEHTGHWQLEPSPLTVVAAIADADGRVLAGGAEGLAWRGDNGVWQPGRVDEPATSATALAASAAGVLAGTGQSGVFRSDDRGVRWRSASFGLHGEEITALATGPGELAVCGTSEGLYRSPNNGRAWRRCAGLREAVEVSAAVFRDANVAVAVVDDQVFISDDNLDHWKQWSPPDGWQTSAVTTVGNAVLLAGPAGVVGSTGDGWSTIFDECVFCVATDGGRVFVGSDRGIAMCEQGHWRNIAAPPVHDFRWIRRARGTTFIAGPSSGLFMFTTAWTSVPTPPGILHALAVTGDAALVISTEHGVYRSPDLGERWKPAVGAEVCAVDHLTFDTSGDGWAASTDGRHLLHTADAGRSWRRLDRPFGTHQLIGLEAGEALTALTLDAWRERARFWTSTDRGRTWRPGGEALVTSSLAPPTMRSLRQEAERHGIPSGQLLDVTQDRSQLWILLPGGEVRWIDTVRRLV